MRWPFGVRRETYDGMVAYYERDVRRLMSDLDGTRERYDEQVTLNRELVKIIVDMKREGFAPEKPAPAVQPKRDDPVAEAIGVAAGGNAEERRRLGRWVASQRAQRVEDEDIIKALLNPAPYEEGVPA